MLPPTGMMLTRSLCHRARQDRGDFMSAWPIRLAPSQVLTATGSRHISLVHQDIPIASDW